MNLVSAMKSPPAPRLPFVARQVSDLLNAHWRFGKLLLKTPGGHMITLEGTEYGPEAQLDIKDYRGLRRVISAGDIGFFDGYRAGEWETQDLHALLEVLSLNLDGIQALHDGGPLMKLAHAIEHALRPNSRGGSKKNILAHYDIGNSFYAEWLDETMTYSAALFDKSASLEDAQARKYEEIARLIDLKAGQSVLEIGCGWGGFAQYAAGTIGAHVSCLTISEAQYEFATARMKRLGLEDKVTILLKDYRDAQGQYDAVVSIEMFEAVGEAYWPTYFDRIRALLKPGGKAGLQIITIREDLFEDYRSRTDFIQKYIFPGGMLPSLDILKTQAERVALKAQAMRAFGEDYARTLRAWRDRFETAWNENRIKGFDIGFKRLWQFYLAYCAAGFSSHRTDVVHLLLEKDKVELA